ncbi:hypothetical protein LguiA_025439 [Lonicera macranthoides]
MKKLYHRKGSTVHPSAPLISDHLAFLPATILTLTLALSLPDREVLAYLLSCSSTNFSGNRKSSRKTTAGGDHPPSFNCNCFRCYMSYWVRWDSSSNRQLIHEIIDAFEDGLVLVQQNKKDNNKKVRRKRGGCSGGGSTSTTTGATSDELNRSGTHPSKVEFGDLESIKEINSSNGEVENEDGEEDGFEKGAVRKFVSSIGERIWSVWTL